MFCRAQIDHVYPLELVLRFVSNTSMPPRFLYAECGKLVGPISKIQKHAVLAMLVQLNAVSGYRVDVPLRSLRCLNFIEAGCDHPQTFRRTKVSQKNLSSGLGIAFG